MIKCHPGITIFMPVFPLLTLFVHINSVFHTEKLAWQMFLHSVNSLPALTESASVQTKLGGTQGHISLRKLSKMSNDFLFCYVQTTSSLYQMIWSLHREINFVLRTFALLRALQPSKFLAASISCPTERTSKCCWCILTWHNHSTHTHSVQVYTNVVQDWKMWCLSNIFQHILFPDVNHGDSDIQQTASLVTKLQTELL